MAYDHFVEHLFPNDLIPTLKRRLNNILGHEKADVIENKIESAIRVLKKLDQFEVVHVIKTWANSWASTFRFHEDKRLPCLLGCPSGQDCMKHYQSRLSLHTIVYDALGKGDDWSEFADLGIANPSREGLRA